MVDAHFDWGRPVTGAGATLRGLTWGKGMPFAPERLRGQKDENQTEVFNALTEARKELLAGLCRSPEGLSSLREWYSGGRNGFRDFMKNVYSGHVPSANGRKRKPGECVAEDTGKDEEGTEGTFTDDFFAKEFQPHYKKWLQIGGKLRSLQCPASAAALDDLIVLINGMRPTDRALLQLYKERPGSAPGKAVAALESTRTRLVGEYTCMVESLARTYNRRFSRSSSDGDAVQNGYLGLLYAIDRYDPGRGMQFSVFAAMNIKQCIKEGFLHDVTIATPPLVRRQAMYMRLEESKLRKKGKIPTATDLARAVNVSERDIANLLQRGRAVISLDQQAGTGGWSTVADTILMRTGKAAVAADPFSLDQAVPSRLLIEQVAAHLPRLPPIQRFVLSARLGVDLTRPLQLRELADQTGLTKQRIEQIEKDAIANLAAILGGNPPVRAPRGRRPAAAKRPGRCEATSLPSPGPT